MKNIFQFILVLCFVLSAQSQVPPVIYLLAPRKAGLTPKILTDALLDFAQSQAGKRFVDDLGHENIVVLVEGDMAAVDVYAEELRPLLK